ncbi:MAG: hypothetical protein AMXMBFR33_68030 [Candidatus Xenobia bacterium]
MVTLLWAACHAEEATLRVAGMTCREYCALRVQAVLEQAEGVERVEVSYEGKRALIWFDPARTRADAVASWLGERTNGRYLAQPGGGADLEKTDVRNPALDGYGVGPR